jgi:capsular polysaccharide biosynthesis protein
VCLPGHAPSSDAVSWHAYWSILRRRRWIIALIVVLDIVVSGFLFRRAYRQVGYQSCLTVYVADVSATSTTLETTDQLLAADTAANFFADDLLDIAQSSNVATWISGRLQGRGLPNSSSSDINGAVSGARRDRTVNLCLANPNQSTALAAARQLGIAMTSQRSRFIGSVMARRTFVKAISPATVGRAPASHALLNLALRVFLGAVVALGVALLWDALDPTVRDRRDVERILGVPVLAEPH